MILHDITKFDKSDDKSDDINLRDISEYDSHFKYKNYFRDIIQVVILNMLENNMYYKMCLINREVHRLIYYSKINYKLSFSEISDQYTNQQIHLRYLTTLQEARNYMNHIDRNEIINLSVVCGRKARK